MNLKITAVLFLFLLMANSIFPDTIVKLKSGEVIVTKDNIPCNTIQSIPDGSKCEDYAVVLERNGSWRKWVKDHYTPHYSYFKIKRGKIKVINQEKILFYKKWFLGKKIFIGKLNE